MGETSVLMDGGRTARPEGYQAPRFFFERRTNAAGAKGNGTAHEQIRYILRVPASDPLDQTAYGEILRVARRWTKSEAEAQDLVQDAVLAALARGFTDWSAPAHQGWLRGVVQKRAAFVVRGEVRRRRREDVAALDVEATSATRWVWKPEFLESLPPSVRAVALLVSADLCAAEICWLLGINNVALRQRLTGLRRSVRAEAEPPIVTTAEPQLSFGQLRGSLLEALHRQKGRAIALHDPDGHGIFLRIGAHKPEPDGNH